MHDPVKIESVESKTVSVIYRGIIGVQKNMAKIDAANVLYAG